MSDLIDRKAVLSLPRLTHRTLSGEIVAEYISVADVEALPEEPSAEPRQKAHWINVRGGNIADYERCNARGRAWMNFCPNCGADMRGEKDENNRNDNNNHNGY